MYLKKIIISGFKSFADKTVLTFNKDITGIVGPNGSGKSNVIDAVRWVMGEQNAKYLRGEVATDIIFAGSEKRQAMAMAEVSLVFDNTDPGPFCPPEYQHEPEISLTRRLYVDGEREYLINRKPCRLKDIVSFFAITGLGGRSYSMIQQGQVDRILNAKPEDVRNILEEAAGTAIYKVRRDEALKKLQATQENLARVEDIVAEINRQQETLQSQMEKALQWKELSDSLREKELNLLGQNYRHFDRQLKEIQNSLNQENTEEAEILGNLAHFESRQVELQEQLNESDPDLQALHEEISRLREEIVRAESTILNAQERVDSNKKRLADLATEIDADMSNLNAFEAQVDAAQSELDNAASEVTRLQEAVDGFQAEVDAVDESAQVFQNRVEDSEDELRNIDRLLESNGFRCEGIERDRQRNMRDKAQLEERVQALDTEIRGAQEDAAAAQETASKAQAGLGDDIAQKAALESENQQRAQQIQELTTRRDDLKEKYFGHKARITSLEELEASASDVAGALCKMREQDTQTDDVVLGLFADFVSIKKDIEELSPKAVAAFERWSERLLVNDLTALNETTKIAQRSAVGAVPVSILASHADSELDRIRSWAEQHDAQSMAPCLKITKAHDAIAALLGRLYYLPLLQLNTDDLTTIPRGAIVFTSQGLIVTDTAEVVITGTATKGILSRRSELEALNKELKIFENNLAEVQSEIDVYNQQTREAIDLISEIDTKLRHQNQDVLAVLAELQAANQLLEHKQELRDAAKIQLDTIEENERSLMKELEDLGQARISLGQERERIKEELEQIQSEFSNIEERREEMQRQAQSRQVELAKCEARAGALRQSFNQIKEQLDRLQNGLTRRYQDRSRLEQEIEDAAATEKRCTDEIEVNVKRREILENELASKREENASVIEEMRVVDQKLKTLREQQNAIQRQTAEKNLELERLRLAICNANDQAQEKYHLDLATLEVIEDPEFNSEKATKEVTKLRGKIENLGAINMMAIDEYNQLIERRNFIDAQRQEVVSSIGVLEQALAEVEETSKNKFMETFEIINLEFSQLFPILFPGGEARLELSNNEDPLNSGVEIMVRMPGKARQRMNLYSGGEKALTAISLIFALLKTKPTPFCFLDEVDAPLDEANVGRYNRVLDALSERFQFIVITHNRRTMEVLDTLYGVTMQEPGVSKIVGVDMNKDLPEHLKKAFKQEDAATRPIQGASSSAETTF